MFTRTALFGLGLVLATLVPAAASAQPYGPRSGRFESMRTAGQLADDSRDLRRFENTATRFDFAVQRGDMAAAHAALNSFLMQGRMEVEEQRRETMQAAREASHSQQRAWQDPSWRGQRQAWDDRRDLAQERAALGQELQALRELEQAAASASMYGLQPQIAGAARMAMQRFIQLATAEMYRTQRELREDLREGRGGWGGDRGYGHQAPPFGAPRRF